MFGNFIEASSTSTGTGDLTLSAITGLKTPHDEFGTSQPFRYAILDSNRLPLESGIAQMSTSSNFQRKWIHEKFDGSSWSKPNAASGFLNLAAGTKYIVCAPLSGGFATNPVRSPIGNNSTANNRLVLPDNYLSVSTGAVTLSANRLYGWPVRIPHTAEYDALGVRMSATGTNIDLALYRMLDTGLPGAKMVGATGIASAAGMVFGTFTAQLLEAGWYVAAVCADLGTAGYYSGVLNEGYGRTDVVTQAPTLYLTNTAGTLPDPFGTPTAIGNLSLTPAICLRKT